MNSIYQHFRENERPFIDQLLDWKNIVMEQYRPKLIDFLDPREQNIVKTVIGEHSDVCVQFFGGYDHAERKRAILYPDYFQPTADDFELTAFEIVYPKKFVNISHREVLGSLMGLGVKRGKFGDILIEGGIVQFIAVKEMERFLSLNFSKVGRTSVQLKPISFHQLIDEKKEMDEFIITVSSLRLDAVIANIHRLSRQKVKALIENGLIKVNWKVTEDAHFEVKEGDVFSVRGYGRSKIISIDGKTKKEKWRLAVGIQK